MRRNGFSLVEMLVAIVTIPLVMGAVTLMFRSLLVDMPRDRRVVNEQFQVDQILRQLQTDLDVTQSLPDQWHEVVRDVNTLILKQSRTVVVYRRQGDLIVRSSGDDPNSEREWTLQYARMRWGLCSVTPDVVAVDVECDVPLKDSRGIHRHFVRNDLYIPGGLSR